MRSALLALPLLLACAREVREVPARDEVSFSEREIVLLAKHSPLGDPPLDPTNAYEEDEAAIRLGEALFHDERLSRTGQFSCASCHHPEHGFTDTKPVAEGLGRTTRRTQTLWNLAWQEWFFRDGRVDSLWAQVRVPLESEVEMGGDRLAAAHLVAEDSGLRAEYEAAFGSMPNLDDTARFPRNAKPMEESEDPRARRWREMSEEDRATANGVLVNLSKAVAAFERTLVNRDAPFDRFVEGLLEGDQHKIAALSPKARRGAKLFVGRGRCRLCHVGPAFSDGEFHSLGLPPLEGGMPTDSGRYEGWRAVLEDPFHAASVWSDEREGRGARLLDGLVGSSANWGEFKTPTLRGVGERPPYMHQGQFESLREVLEFYSTLEGRVGAHGHQERLLVPLGLSEGEMEDLEAFLESLSGSWPP